MLSRCVADQGGMGPPVVVFVLPGTELVGQFVGVPEENPPVELLLVRAVAPFDLDVAFGAAPRNPAVRNAQIMQVSHEVAPELGAVVGLDPLEGHGEAPTDLFKEVERGLRELFVGVDFHDMVPRGFIRGG